MLTTYLAQLHRRRARLKRACEALSRCNMSRKKRNEDPGAKPTTANTHSGNNSNEWDQKHPPTLVQHLTHIISSHKLEPNFLLVKIAFSVSLLYIMSCSKGQNPYTKWSIESHGPASHKHLSFRLNCFVFTFYRYYYKSYCTTSLEMLWSSPTASRQLLRLLSLLIHN